MSNTEKERREEQSKNAIKENFRAKEAAVYLGIGLSTVWLFAKEGKLNPLKLSDRVTIFTKKDLDRFVSEGEAYV